MLITATELKMNLGKYLSDHGRNARYLHYKEW